MIIDVETNLQSNIETIIEYVNYTKTLDYIAKPLLVFEPKNQNVFPEFWKKRKISNLYEALWNYSFW